MSVPKMRDPRRKATGTGSLGAVSRTVVCAAFMLAATLARPGNAQIPTSAPTGAPTRFCPGNNCLERSDVSSVTPPFDTTFTTVRDPATNCSGCCRNAAGGTGAVIAVSSGGTFAACAQLCIDNACAAVEYRCEVAGARSQCSLFQINSITQVAPTTGCGCLTTTLASQFPTVAPTVAPTVRPTAAPTVAPSVPTTAPTLVPTARPTAAPTLSPTSGPTTQPTTAAPTTFCPDNVCLEESNVSTVSPPFESTFFRLVDAGTNCTGCCRTNNGANGTIVTQSFGVTLAQCAQLCIDNFCHAVEYTCAAPPARSRCALYGTDIVRVALTPGCGCFTTTFLTESPTARPTAAPTRTPSAQPTESPSAAPSRTPTTSPTNVPTTAPTSVPTASPTLPPSAQPTSAPTSAPSRSPTAAPTIAPTRNPCDNPEDNSCDTTTTLCIPNFNLAGSVTGRYHCECIPDHERINNDQCSASPTTAPTVQPTRAPVSLAPTSVPTGTPVSAAPTSSPTLTPTQGSAATKSDDDDNAMLDWWLLLAILLPLLCCILLLLAGLCCRGICFGGAATEEEEEDETVVAVVPLATTHTVVQPMRVASPMRVARPVVQVPPPPPPPLAVAKGPPATEHWIESPSTIRENPRYVGRPPVTSAAPPLAPISRSRAADVETDFENEPTDFSDVTSTDASSADVASTTDASSTDA
eukprot:m.127545 g.127545  ORF g.127545 m.127545 type:complete len:694 (+) comp22238_c0_seq2:31-2112(+)